MKFTINGNHEDQNGNPIPKARFTHRQQFTSKAGRYHEYLDYVRGRFTDSCFKQGKVNAREKFDMQHFDFIDRKPLNTGNRKCFMRIFITWGSENHGDPENIFGAIADAIFQQDKYLAGAIDFDPVTRSAGRVDVEIQIGEDRCGLHSWKGIKVAKQRA